MAQGSTGFSKREIDALMVVLNNARCDKEIDEYAYTSAYTKLWNVQRRLS